MPQKSKGRRTLGNMLRGRENVDKPLRVHTKNAFSGDSLQAGAHEADWGIKNTLWGGGGGGEKLKEVQKKKKKKNGGGGGGGKGTICKQYKRH